MALRPLGAVFVLLVLVASACSADTMANEVTSPTSIALATPTLPPVPTPTASESSTPTPQPTPSPTPEPTPTVDPLSITAESLDEAVARSTLEPTECPDGARNAATRCSIARVPLRADDLTGDSTVDLMVAYVDNGDPFGIGPVVYLQGGPGVASVGSASRFVGLDYDVVVFDQRGVGLSTPNLECPEVDAFWVDEHTDNEDDRVAENSDVFLDAYGQCHDRLVADGVDLDAFNTEAVADDVEILRRLLGRDSWSIWGVSYGTRIALTIMRDHPEGLRAAVLDSVVPFEIDFFATLARNGLRAIDALDEACDLDSCADRHGDFSQNLRALVSELDGSPRVVIATRPSSGETFPFRVDGAELVNLVFTELYVTSALPSLPRQVARLDQGGLDELVGTYMRSRDPERRATSLGIYYSTWCREEYPFHDAQAPADFAADTADPVSGALAQALDVEGIGEVCTIFDVEPAAFNEDLPVISGVPTLVFAGSFDPITPPDWSRQVADTLENATFVEMADHGHGMATACPIRIRLAFLVEPGAELDLACATTTDGPRFD